MKRTLQVVVAVLACNAAGYGLTLVNNDARHFTRHMFIWLWMRVPFNPNPYRIPDSFAERGTRSFVLSDGQVTTLPINQAAPNTPK